MSEATPAPPANGAAPDADRVRPVSARPGAPPQPQAPPSGPAGAEGPQGHVPSGPAGAEGPQGRVPSGPSLPQTDRRPQPQRPSHGSPARRVQPGSGAPNAEPDAPAPPRTEPEPVRLTIEGAEWVVRAAGQGASGRASGGAAPLVLLTFAPADRPDAPTLEVLTLGRSVDGIAPLELERLFHEARPYAKAYRRQAIFPDAKGGKKDV